MNSQNNNKPSRGGGIGRCSRGRMEKEVENGKRRGAVLETRPVISKPQEECGDCQYNAAKTVMVKESKKCSIRMFQMIDTYMYP